MQSFHGCHTRADRGCGCRNILDILQIFECEGTRLVGIAGVPTEVAKAQRLRCKRIASVVHRFPKNPCAVPLATCRGQRSRAVKANNAQRNAPMDSSIRVYEGTAPSGRKSTLTPRFDRNCNLSALMAAICHASTGSLARLRKS